MGVRKQKADRRQDGGIKPESLNLTLSTHLLQHSSPPLNGSPSTGDEGLQNMNLTGDILHSNYNATKHSLNNHFIYERKFTFK